MTRTAKRKVCVSLNEDLVAELENADETLSAQINEAIRTEVERRKQSQRLQEFLDELDEERGPVPEELLEKYTRILG